MNIPISAYILIKQKMNQTQQQSKQKFIALMHDLIQYINQNSTVQLTIYQCLNTQQIKRLFQSLHDHSKILRITALIFITKLLYNSPQIIDTLLTRNNCDVITKKISSGNNVIPLQKYIITGLNNYKMEIHVLVDIINIVNNKVKFKKNVLFWYVEISTKCVGYVMKEEQLDNFGIDPQTHIIGIFVSESETVKEKQPRKTVPNPSTPSSIIRKNMPEQNKTKYTIAKKGFFSGTKTKF